METGYALDINQARFYLMETHYNNPRNVDDFSSITMDQKADNSGLKLFYIDKLRKYDAGVLSIGKINIELNNIKWIPEKKKQKQKIIQKKKVFDNKMRFKLSAYQI